MSNDACMYSVSNQLDDIFSPVIYKKDCQRYPQALLRIFVIQFFLQRTYPPDPHSLFLISLNHVQCNLTKWIDIYLTLEDEGKIKRMKTESWSVSIESQWTLQTTCREYLIKFKKLQLSIEQTKSKFHPTWKPKIRMFLFKLIPVYTV